MLTAHPDIAEADRFLEWAEEILDQAWRTADNSRAVISLVDAYFDVRRARANIRLAAGGQPERPERRAPAGHQRKLTEEQVREIRSRYAAGDATQLSLAIEYGISQSAVHKIVSRQTWRDVA